MTFSFQARKQSIIPACRAHYAPDAIRFTPPRQAEIILFATSSFHLPSDDPRVDNASSAMRPLLQC